MTNVALKPNLEDVGAAFTVEKMLFVREPGRERPFTRSPRALPPAWWRKTRSRWRRISSRNSIC